MVELNLRIQAIESAGVEKAMDLRDKRDLLIDELSGLARITYREDNMGVVHVELEQVEFIDEVTYHPVGNLTDRKTGFVTPYWPHMSEINDPDDPTQNYYYPIYDLTNVSAEKDSDIGEVKALLMARGENNGNIYFQTSTSFILALVESALKNYRQQVLLMVLVVYI